MSLMKGFRTSDKQMRLVDTDNAGGRSASWPVEVWPCALHPGGSGGGQLLLPKEGLLGSELM